MRVLLGRSCIFASLAAAVALHILLQLCPIFGVLHQLVADNAADAGTLAIVFLDILCGLLECVQGVQAGPLGISFRYCKLAGKLLPFHLLPAYALVFGLLGPAFQLLALLLQLLEEGGRVYRSGKGIRCGNGSYGVCRCRLDGFGGFATSGDCRLLGSLGRYRIIRLRERLILLFGRGFRG